MSYSGPVTVTTSKQWVLPPRPKNGRKTEGKKRKANNESSLNCTSNCPITESVELTNLNRNIKCVDRENYQLKLHLLTLIGQYKQLRKIVIDNSDRSHQVPSDCSRKRSFHDTEMNSLISNMQTLSHDPEYSDSIDSLTQLPIESKDPFLDLLNLEEEQDLHDEDLDDDMESTSLSRYSSTASDYENSLMTSLTRSTTVSTNNSSVLHSKPTFKHFDLPIYNDLKSSFTFEDINPHEELLMSTIQEDHYNQVTDFLEEKLIANDVSYYTNQQEL